MFNTSIIIVRGPDAFEFLQGQLSNDLEQLEKQTSILASWCNPKGRVICLADVTRNDDGYQLIVPGELAEDVVRRLSMYRFRAAVDFDTAPGGEIDPAARISAGIPWIGLSASERYTPHMLNLDLLGGISLDKGCYTGQEVVARTHYKGATKRRTLRFESATPVSAGDRVSADNRDIGEVLNVAGTDLLAVLPLDKTNAELSVHGAVLSSKPLPYEFPDLTIGVDSR